MPCSTNPGPGDHASIHHHPVAQSCPRDDEDDLDHADELLVVRPREAAGGVVRTHAPSGLSTKQMLGTADDVAVLRFADQVSGERVLFFSLIVFATDVLK
ncbi:hypothetical protein MN608_04672 [Microdochium nivale]|nr:hypothetical protein MN608_04672 [Microdochium nivale]